MTPEECSRYYLEHKDEFAGEDGHEALLKLLKMRIKPIKTEKKVVAIDVGACTGNYIHHLEALCPEPGAAILAFEPNPVNIRAWGAEHMRAQLYPYGVSDQDTRGSLFNWKGMAENKRGNLNAGLRAGGDKICDIEVVRLDTILAQEHGSKDDIVIKFIKIDTEGNDTNVIKGLGDYIDAVRYMIFECSDCLDDCRGPGVEGPMRDIVTYLSARGFDTYRIGTRKMLRVNDEYWSDIYEKVKFWSNCFAIRKGDVLIGELMDDTAEYLS